MNPTALTKTAFRNIIIIYGRNAAVSDIAGGIAEAYYGIPDLIRSEAMTFLDDEMREIVVRFKEKYQK